MTDDNSATFHSSEAKSDKLSRISLSNFEAELISLLAEAAACVEKYLEASKNEETKDTACKVEPLLKSTLCAMYSKVGDIKYESLFPEVLEYLASSSEVTRIMKSLCDFVRVVFGKFGTTGLSMNLISS